MKRGKWILHAAIGLLAATGVAPGQDAFDNPAGLMPRQELDLRRTVAQRAAISVPQPNDPTTPAVAAGPVRELADSLEFLDRDRMRGTLVSFTHGDYGLVWKRSDAKESFLLAPTNIMQVKMGGRKPIAHKDPTVAVRLLNGDTLTGDIAMLDETTLTLDTWYSGRLSIKRPAILQVAMKGATGRTIYEGPNSLNEWVMGPGGGRMRDQWRFDNGTLLSMYPSALTKRFDKLPDLCEFRFTASWQQYAQMGFMFFTELMDQNPVSGYSLTVSGSTIYLQAFNRNMGSQQLGTANYEKFDRGKRSAEFTILANRKTNTFTVLIDGEQLRRWTDARNLGAGQSGNSIMLQPQGQPGLRFRNIRIAEWDGKVPDPAAAPTAQKEDIVRLNNSDKLSGRLNSISNDAIQFTTSYATLTVPMTRVEEIVFSVPSTNTPPPEAGSVRISFAETSQVTVQVKKIANEQVSCTGAAFGDIALPLPAVKTLDFNLDKRKPVAADDVLTPDGMDPFDGGVIIE